MDPAWDMPFANYQTTGSFKIPAAAPLLGPDEGTLVALPCINQDWLLVLMGALDQLRNPSTWVSGSPSALDVTLSRVTKLQEMVWSAMDNPCCDVAMRLTADCHLQFSTDGGSTWHDVDGWTTNIGGCVRSNIPLVPPPNPMGTGTNQFACNLAGFLAAEVLQQALIVAHTALAAGNTVLQYFQQLAADIATGNPLLEVLVTVANDLYPTVQAQPIADVASASTDPLLWAEVTCAIYNCIKGVGYVDATNFACVAPRIAAIPYHLTWVPPLVAGLWNNLGLTFIQQAEYPGAIDDVDCTDCAEWCFRYDFTTGMQGWSLWTAGGASVNGVFTAGVGWQSAVDSADCPADHFTNLAIHIVLGSAITVNNVQFHHIDPNAAGTNSCYGQAREIQLRLGGSVVTTLSFEMTAHPSGQTEGGITGPWTFDEAILVYRTDGTGQTDTVTYVQFGGQGTNPLGTSNCTI